MPRESKNAKRERVIQFCEVMDGLYPMPEAPLVYHNPFELVICVLLSAQTTDKSVNKVTPELFRRWPDAPSLAAAPLDEVGAVIRITGFWKTKAKHAVEAAQMIVSDYGGEVPRTMEELTRLPGVGRKTANIVLNKGFGIVEGIAVDTHVYRIAKRLKFSNATSPADCEKDLLALIPQELWAPVNEQWIYFGREVCNARSPHCDSCPVRELCPSARA